MLNLLDIFILALFILSLLLCAYQGFLRSCLTLASFLLACLLSFAFSPLMANSIEQIEPLRMMMLSYSEGSELLDESDFELARKPISQLSNDEITGLLARGKFPYPLGRNLEKNIYSAAFAGDGITQLNDYIALTYYHFVCHILGFWSVFLVAFIVSLIVVAVIDRAISFSVLRRFDSLLSLLLGIVLAILLTMLFMLFVPVVLFAIGRQIPLIQEMVDQSFFAKLFYRHNFFFFFIRAK